MRFLKIVSILILVAVSACLSTTGVVAPEQVNPNSSFITVVTVQVDSSSASIYRGYIGVLVPIGWEVDSVTYSGPNSGNMHPFGASSELNLELLIPSSHNDHWLEFKADTTFLSSQGETYEVTMRIHTDSKYGSFDIAFLGYTIYMGGAGPQYSWNGDPCSTTVEVVELNLEQSTWGSVKSEFSL